jgi:hypothetical protein
MKYDLFGAFLGQHNQNQQPGRLRCQGGEHQTPSFHGKFSTAISPETLPKTSTCGVSMVFFGGS